MLRTHGELGYKQEQRFHLELGLLKMAHAQRLLPIEQLLSDVAASAPVAGAGSSAPRSLPRPSIVGGITTGAASDTRRTEPAPVARPNYVSPFAADSARKGTPHQELASAPPPANGPRIVAAASTSQPVIMGAAAPANLPETSSEPEADTATAAPQTEPPFEENFVPQAPTPPVTVATTQLPFERLQSAVLQALSEGNQRILISMLEAGEWSVQANEVIIKVAESQTVIDMSVSPEARRLAIASASGVLGRAVKLKIVPGGVAAPQDGNGSKHNGSAPATGPKIGGRNRAEEDPVVQRMREKFGAEIRTVIDYRDKR